MVDFIIWGRPFSVKRCGWKSSVAPPDPPAADHLLCTAPIPVFLYSNQALPHKKLRTGKQHVRIPARTDIEVLIERFSLK